MQQNEWVGFGRYRMNCIHLYIPSNISNIIHDAILIIFTSKPQMFPLAFDSINYEQFWLL